MTKQPDGPGVGASVPIAAIIASLVAIALVAGGIYLYRVVNEEVAYRHLVIATGSESGAYHALGNGLKRILERSDAFSSVQIKSTEGSAVNMQLIDSKNMGADLAFVQGDASPSTNARLITTLYDEVLHILVSTAGNNDIHSIYDLQGKRVSLGAAGSGTRGLAQRVLRHFDIKVMEDLVLPPLETAQGLADGSIDAAFMLSAIPSALISELAQQDTVRFLSLDNDQETSEEGDEAHALELIFPGVHRDTIPRSAYGRLPKLTAHTISVTAMLIARQDLDEELVRSITAIVFGNRAGVSGLEGRELMIARKIRENYDPSSVNIPYHGGAIAYYHREEPPFFVEYAEALSLGLTLMLAIYSVFIALREWFRRRMKNRVDAYLLEVERLATDFQTLDHHQLVKLHAEMEKLRRSAFADLVAERLLADEAFLILQNHLRDELSDIKIQIEKSTGEPGNT